jgi:hypothetical protein
MDKYTDSACNGKQIHEETYAERLGFKRISRQDYLESPVDEFGLHAGIGYCPQCGGEVEVDCLWNKGDAEPAIVETRLWPCENRDCGSAEQPEGVFKMKAAPSFFDAAGLHITSARHDVIEALKSGDLYEAEVAYAGRCARQGVLKPRCFDWYPLDEGKNLSLYSVLASSAMICEAYGICAQDCIQEAAAYTDNLNALPLIVEDLCQIAQAAREIGGAA